MTARRRRRFEEHLLACEDCWREVAAGRLGRRLAESARELAPQDLRERVRAAVAAMPPPRRPRWAFGATAAAVSALAAVVVLVLPAGQPAPIARAVADFREGRIPTARDASVPAPDLSAMSLRLVASGTGSLDGQRVDAYGYRDTSGHRLLLYLSDTAFPVAAGASRASPDGPWRARIDGLELLCSDRPHALLAVSDDAQMLAGLARALAILGNPA